MTTLADRAGKRLPTATTPLWPLAIARVFLGLLWLSTLRWKLPPNFDGGDQRGLREWLEVEVEHTAFGFYADVIDSVVLPNFTFFAWAVFLAELLTGLSLVLGLATRLGALLGLAMSINLGIGLLDVPGEWPWSYVLMSLFHALFLVAGAGRVWGIDAYLHRKPVWRSIT